MRQKSIALKFFRVPYSWEVVEISNSAQLNPGDWINHDYLLWFEKHDDWNFTVVEANVDVSGVVKNLVPLVPPVL